MKTIFTFLICTIFIPVIASGQIITTIAGNGIIGNSGDNGLAISAEFNQPTDVAVDNSGNVYIADVYYGVIRKVNTAGIITTFAGGGHSVDYNGTPATSVGFARPNGISVDRLGNLYIADFEINVIFKVDTFGNIHIVAGNTISYGYSGDGGPATIAELNAPVYAVTDATGNIYIADNYNNVIRKVNIAGTISTFAGNGYGAGLGSGGFGGDNGPATAAMLWQPTSVAVDRSGNCFIADAFNYRIRKVNSSGIISTVACCESGGTYGDGGPATAAGFYQIVGVAADNYGNFYMSDLYNNVIRKVDTLGIINTFAGNGSAGYGGDGGNAVLAELNNQAGLAIDAHGNVFIADEQNHRIREVIVSSEGISQIRSENQRISLYPSPTQNILNIASSTPIVNITITNLLGQIVYTHEYNTEKVQIDVTDMPTSVYFIKINNTEVRKFVKE